jgi:hypothetical protein
VEFVHVIVMIICSYLPYISVRENLKENGLLIKQLDSRKPVMIEIRRATIAWL